MFDFDSTGRPSPSRSAVYADAQDGFPDADAAALHFDAPPEAVIRAWDRVAGQHPRVSITLCEPGEGRHACVQRSRVFRFPDDISARAVPSEGGTRLLLCSAARMGRHDFGVNARRLKDWSGELARALGQG